MLHSLIDRVSKNGNMLLNISPTAEGEIPQGQRDVLATIGAYLRPNGEAVYATRAWSVYGEGPNRAGGGSFTAPLTGGPTDIRFTRDKAATVLYATVLGWPGDNAVLTIETLGGNRVDLSRLRQVHLLGDRAGAYLPLAHTQDAAGLRVTMPAAPPAQSDAYVVKLTFAGHIPTPRPAAGAEAFSGYRFTGTGGALPIGQYTAAALATRNLPARAISSVRPVPGYQLIGYPGDDFTGTPWILDTETADLRTTGADNAIVSVQVRFGPTADFHVVNLVSSLALSGGGTVGTTMTLTSPEDRAEQRFQLVETDGGHYRLMNRATDSPLTAAAPPTRVRRWDSGTGTAAPTCNGCPPISGTACSSFATGADRTRPRRRRHSAVRISGQAVGRQPEPAVAIRGFTLTRSD